MVLNFFNSSNRLSAIQNKNIILGFLLKFIGIILNLLLIPLLIKFLGKTEYGVWVTVFSIVNWILTFDLGIGTGLRNKLTESLALDDYFASNKIISTSYIVISVLAVIMIFILFPLILFFNFQIILNYSDQGEYFLKIFIAYSVLFTVINFVLTLYKKLYLSVHKSYIVEFSNSIFILLYLVLVFSIIEFNCDRDLLMLIKIHGFSNIFISFVFTILFFKLNNKLKISFKFYEKKLVKPLFNLGGKFFLINICLIVILFTDNLIITNLLGPSFVSDYSVIQKIFQLFIVIFNVVIASSWGLYSKAIIDKDYVWISKNLIKMHYYLFFFIIGAVIVFFFLEDILNIWIGKDVVNIPNGLALANLFYIISFSFANIYTYFINATGEINLQLKLFVLGAIINIPLSIILVEIFESSTGVMVSTICCTLPLVVAMPLQTRFILNRLKRSNQISNNFK